MHDELIAWLKCEIERTTDAAAKAKLNVVAMGYVGMAGAYAKVLEKLQESDSYSTDKKGDYAGRIDSLCSG